GQSRRGSKDRLEVEFGSELDDAGGISAADSARNCTERLGVESIHDRVGVGVVVLEEVEEIKTQLKIGRLLELESFDRREVVIDQARHTKCAGARRVAERCGLSRDKRGRVKPV